MSWSVLFVDDEPIARDLFRMVFERAKFNVIDAEDGTEALAKIKDKKPDVVVLDVMMPGMDGFSICRTIRSNPETEKLPIVMLSARTHNSAINEGMDAGADLYLSKLTPHRELVKHLHGILGPQNGP